MFFNVLSNKTMFQQSNLYGMVPIPIGPSAAIRRRVSAVKPPPEATTVTHPRSTGRWRCRRGLVMRRSLGFLPAVVQEWAGLMVV